MELTKCQGAFQGSPGLVIVQLQHCVHSQKFSAWRKKKHPLLSKLDESEVGHKFASFCTLGKVLGGKQWIRCGTLGLLCMRREINPPPQKRKKEKRKEITKNNKKKWIRCGTLGKLCMRKEITTKKLPKFRRV